MQTLWQDIRYGFRILAKTPGFTTVAALSLALGIGGNTAIFSVVNAVILNPLPQKDSARLVHIQSVEKEHGWREGISPRTWYELRQLEVFSALVVDDFERLTWKGEDFAEDVDGSFVSPHFFDFWNVRPLLGRTFAPEEGKPGSPPVIILSHEFWQSHLGGRPDIIGQTTHFMDRTFTVIGVMPPHVRFPRADGRFWLPFEGPPLTPPAGHLEGWDYRDRSYRVAARLRPGVTNNQLQSVLDVIAQRQAKDCPRTCGGWTIEARPLRYLFSTEQVQQTLWSLFAAIGFVLLIACANIINLLLARNEARQREWAVRAALGAGRWRLVRQLLTETTLLAVLGGTSGLLISWWGTRFLKTFIPWYVPSIKSVGIDFSMLGFTLLMSVAVGLAVGLIPAWLACQRRIDESLKESAALTSVSMGRKIAGRLLVVSELALTVVLLTGVVLMINSVIRLSHVDPGFDPTNLLRVDVYTFLPGETEIRPEAKDQMILQMQEHFAALLGVNAVGVGIDPQLIGDEEYLPDGSDQPVIVNELATGVGPSDSLRTMRVPLLAGRYFETVDRGKGQNTIVVNETLARSCWPGQDAVGSKLRSVRNSARVLEVVGVVGDVRDQAYAEQVQPTYYRPLEHHYDLSRQRYFLLVRTRTDPSLLIPALRREMKALVPGMRMPSFRIVEHVLYDSTAQNRLYMGYLSCFAAVGLLLSAIGIYGVLAWMVTRLTREIGIRMALGASPRRVLGLVLRQGLFMTCTGILLGVVAATALTRFLSSYLFGVDPLDPLSFIGASLLLGTVAMLACYLPARRAAKIDPMVALRYEW